MSPPSPSCILAPCLLGLAFPRLGVLPSPPVTQLAPRLRAFPAGTHSEMLMPLSEPLANICRDLKGEDGE